METIKKIYKQFDWYFSPEYEAIIQQYLDEDKAKREAIKSKKSAAELHTYTPEEFSIPANELLEGKFAEYCAKFNVPMSKN